MARQNKLSLALFGISSLLAQTTEACSSALRPNMLGNLNTCCQAQYPLSISSDTTNWSQDYLQSCNIVLQDNDALNSTELPLSLDEQQIPSPIYTVRSIPGKGLGLIASQAIAPGTKILIEAPLFTVSMPEMVAGQGFRIQDMITDIELQFSTLSPTQQDEFLALHDHRFPGDSDSHLLTIFRSNAYNTGDNQVGAFPKTARINHSCRPNCGNFWSEGTGTRIIYAQREIGEGEEITVSYIPLLKSIKERQARLQQYGFVCDCVACQDAESSKKRVRIADLLEELEGKAGKVYGGGSKKKEKEILGKLVGKAEKLVRLLEEEGLGDYLARGYRVASTFEEKREEFNTALAWARKELAVHVWANEDSDETSIMKRHIERFERELK